MENVFRYQGWYPATVKSYDANKRTCRVSIAGVTDGGNNLPEAEIAFPVGDKSAHGGFGTELEILPNDLVWVVFQGGDSRYPIITAYRNPRTGNTVGTRRYHHANIEQLTDSDYHVKSGSTIRAEAGSTVIVEAGSSITLKVGGASLIVESGSITLTAGTINLNGAVSAGGSGGASATFSGSLHAEQDVTSGGISLQTHTHKGDSGGSTGTPR